jgi:hypothetical protein
VIPAAAIVRRLLDESGNRLTDESGNLLVDQWYVPAPKTRTRTLPVERRVSIAWVDRRNERVT